MYKSNYGGILMHDKMVDDRKKIKNKSNKPIILVFSILGFALLAAGIFLGTYYFLIDRNSNSYESNIKEIIKNINTVNVSTVKLSNNDKTAIDPDKARKELPGIIKALTDNKTKLQGLVPSEKHNDNHETLLNGLSNNILVYRQITAFLDNVNGKDIEAAGESLKKYKDDCINDYSKVSSNSVFKISLPTETTVFIDNTLNYINKLAGVLKEKEVILSQNLDFIGSIDEILSGFNKIKVDLSSEILAARNTTKNYDSVISLANRYRDDLNQLKQQLSNLSVPSEANNSYKLLTNTFQTYDLYLQNTIFAINNEKLLGDSATPEKLQDLYASSNLKFSEVTKNFNSFLKYYADFKDANVQ
jgi:hypothetical protein